MKTWNKNCGDLELRVGSLSRKVGMELTLNMVASFMLEDAETALPSELPD